MKKDVCKLLKVPPSV
jgi:hypothetical protein